MIVLFVFLGVIILWSFKDLIVDWTGINYRDENAAILGGILLFLIPSSHEKKKMLEWKDTEKLPWGILLLFGGGLALAQIFEKNGVMVVQSDFKLSTVDIVSDPSGPGCFVNGIMENVDWVYDPVHNTWHEEKLHEVKKAVHKMSKAQLEEKKLAIFESYLTSLLKSK